MRESIDACIPHIQSARAETATARAETANLLVQLDAARAETATVRAETANLLVQMDAARAETATATARAERATATARAETANLLVQLDAARAQAANLLVQMDAARAQAANLLAQRDTARAETANVLVRLDAASAKARKAEDTAEAARADVKALRAKARKAEDTTEAARAETANVLVRLDALRAKARKAEDTAAAARAEAVAANVQGSLPAFIDMRRLELDSIERENNGMQIIQDLFQIGTLRGGVGAVRFGLLNESRRVAVKIFVDGYIGDNKGASSYLTNELQVLSALLAMYGFDGLRRHCIVRPLGMASVSIMPKGGKDKQYISSPALVLEEWRSPPPPRMPRVPRTPNAVNPPPVRTLEQLLEWAAEGWRQTVRIIRDIAVGLAAMHKAGFAHNDIKDDNVLVCLTADGAFCTACVTDMSHASSVDGNGQYTGNGDKCGAPSDVGAVGRMIRKLLLGKTAWDTSLKKSEHYKQMQDLAYTCLRDAQERPPMASVVDRLEMMKD